MEWLLDIDKSGYYVLASLIILFVGVVVMFIKKEYYKPWKEDYYRDKDLLMKKDKFLYRIFRMLN